MDCQSVQRMFDALQAKRFFKLIGGGSLTDSERLASSALAYSLADADCIDISPDMGVVQAVDKALSTLSGVSDNRPALMVSIPLDPDPHFRKIDLDEPNCIRCGACIPVCPTEAISLPEALEISQSLCYGCGRCIPTCPTDALRLLLFQVERQLETVLAYPRVEAVEIHSHYVDPYMLQGLFERWQDLLTQKLISLCFRPGMIPSSQILDFYQVAAQACALPVILQVDGAPMSGNDAPEASLPALEAAVQVRDIFQKATGSVPIITISGGINPHTAKLLQEPDYHFIAGVGMGTVARKAVWHLDTQTAKQVAIEMVYPFKNRG